MEQKSKEWFDARKGKWTASNLDCLLVKGKSESTLGAGAITLCYEKLAERMSTETREFTSQFTDWGIDHEKEAIEFFENNTLFEVDEVGFINAPREPPKKKGGAGIVDNSPKLSLISGGSPDGLVVKDVADDEGNQGRTVEGIIEVKCPHDPSIHLHTLIHKELHPKNAKKYYAQMQWNMYCTQTDVCYFISYDPRMKKDEHKMVVLEIKRDDEHIELLKERILLAEDYLQGLKSQIETSTTLEKQI